MNTLFIITIVLDTIPELPTLYYQPLNGVPCCKFSDASLTMNNIRSIIKQLKGCRKIRILSNNILRHDIIYLPELSDIELETIVDYQYYISHLDEIANLDRQLNIIVDIKNILTFDNSKSSYSNNEKVSVTFCCQIQNIEEIKVISNIQTKIKPYPSNAISRQLAHYFLDYSEEDLYQMRITKSQLFLNKVVNTNFYGNVIIDNDGNINSYPITKYAINNHSTLSQVLPDIRQNKFWYLTRDKFFSKCSDCAFATICPPLTNYEINSEETFCPY